VDEWFSDTPDANPDEAPAAEEQNPPVDTDDNGELSGEEVDAAIDEVLGDDESLPSPR